MQKTISYIATLLLITTSVFSQEATEAYLIGYSDDSAQFTVTDVTLLSSYNKNGYNNQPFFEAGDLYLSSSTGPSISSGTDIVKLNIRENKLKYITKTREREYSPMIFQGDLYFIRQDPETDYQELWSLKPDGLEKVLHYTNVAYYRFIDPDRIALALLDGNNLNLYIHNFQDGSKKLISDHVGRSFQLLDAENLIFVHKYSPDYWHIKKYNYTTGRVSIVQKTLKGAEDFNIKDRLILMGKDSNIYSLDLSLPSPQWTVILDLEKFGLSNIKRLAENNNNQFVVINQ